MNIFNSPFILIALFILLCIVLKSHCTNRNCTSGCADSCLVCDTGKYNLNDKPGDFASADLAIEELKVTTDSTGYLVDVYVKDGGDHDAMNTSLVISLPINASLISAFPDHQQCGAAVKFCLGDVLYRESRPRHFTIRTTYASLPGIKKHLETFGAYVYSTSPDPCPANNFRCSEIQFRKHVWYLIVS